MKQLKSQMLSGTIALKVLDTVIKRLNLVHQANGYRVSQYHDRFSN